MKRNFQFSLSLLPISCLIIVLGILFNKKAKQFKQRKFLENNFEKSKTNEDENQEAPVSNEEIINHIQKTTEWILENFPAESNKIKKWNTYNGATGLSYFFWKLYKSEVNPDRRQNYLNQAILYLKQAGKLRENEKIKFPKFTCGFLYGAAGYFTMGSILYHHTKEEEKSEFYLQSLISELEKATVPQSKNLNFSFGTAGYFSCCLFLRENIPSFPIQIIPLLFGYLVNRGEEDWRFIQSFSSLIYKEPHKRLSYVYPSIQTAMPLISWSNSTKFGRFFSFLLKPIVYLYLQFVYCRVPKELHGVLHGNAGCIFQILCCPELVHSSREATILLTNSLEFLINSRNKNGTYPSGLIPIEFDNTFNQWCNGTTGIAILFTRAYEVFQDTKYLKAAIEASEVVWRFGLLKKGSNLCHGIAGNGYLFLILYRITKEDKYLRRAQSYGKYIIQNFSLNQKPSEKDYSLFEGIPGSILFLNDLLQPENARFPILEDCL